MIDIHSHILWGVDDGSESLKESRKMLSAAKAAGVDWIVATPHVRREPIDVPLMEARYEELLPIAREKGVKLELGFEVHWNMLVTMGEASCRDFCARGRRVLLVEFSLSADDLPEGHERMIYTLQRSGIRIIIAHPERYRFVQRDPEKARRWLDMGCQLQLDANCLLQSYEPKSKPAARRLFKMGVYDYLASDAHCAGDYELFAKALDWAEKHQEE